MKIICYDTTHHSLHHHRSDSRSDLPRMQVFICIICYLQSNSSPETLLSQYPDHRSGLFGCVDLTDQGQVLFCSAPVTGAQVDQRRAAVEKCHVQQSSDLVGGKHEHGSSPQ